MADTRYGSRLESAEAQDSTTLSVSDDTSNRPLSRLWSAAGTAGNEITSLNSLQSPLLQLPPELRKQIYCHVLGNQEIHMNSVYPDHDTYVATVCHCPTSEWEFICSLGQGETPRQALRHGTRHRNCLYEQFYEEWKHVQVQHLDLSILLVCHQIHNEAALIPFANNRFVFDTTHDMFLWKEAVMPVQYEALESVIFAGPVNDPYSLGKLAKDIADWPALKQLGFVHLSSTTPVAGVSFTTIIRNCLNQYGPYWLKAIVAIVRSEASDFKLGFGVCAETSDRRHLSYICPVSIRELQKEIDESIASLQTDLV